MSKINKLNKIYDKIFINFRFEELILSRKGINLYIKNKHPNPKSKTLLKQIYPPIFPKLSISLL